MPETGYTPHQAAITGMAEWVNKSLHLIAQNTTKSNDDEIVNSIVNKLNNGTDSRAKRIVHYRGGSATANSISYTEQKDKNGNPIYKPTKEIFKVNDCYLISGEKKEYPKINGKRAPWMEIVLEEAKNYGGHSEGVDPLKTRIKNEYFAIPNEFTNNKTEPTSVSWCAVFASWCLKKAKYSNPSTCRALEFNPEYMHDGPNKPDKLSNMRKITKPVYGCIIVWKNKSGGGGHVGFHYGYEANGNIIPLGGNQGNSLQFSSRNPNGDYGQTIVGYFLPIDYEDNEEDEFLPEELKYNAKELNNKLLNKSSNIISGKTT